MSAKKEGDMWREGRRGECDVKVGVRGMLIMAEDWGKR